MRKWIIRAAIAVIVLAGLAFARAPVTRMGSVRDAYGMLRYAIPRMGQGEVKVGDKAPDVELISTDGAARLHLREKIVARGRWCLYSAAIPDRPFRTKVGYLAEMYERFKENAEFLTIYIRESTRKTSGRWTPTYNKTSVTGGRESLSDRVAIVKDFVARFSYPIPIVIDTMARYRRPDIWRLA